MDRRKRSARRRALAARKRFSRFTATEVELLVGLRDTLDARCEQVIEAFYEHLGRFEALRGFLSDPAIAAKLKAYQRRYLMSLTSGSYDDDYVQDRLRIGQVHERIGLAPQWYLGAYCILIERLVPVVQERYGAEPETAQQALTALAKLMNLDAQIVLDSYFEARQQRAVAHSEQLAAVGELAASIAHEVRNPLAGMKGALQMLRRPLADDDAKLEVMDEVIVQIERLEGLVRDLLNFARPDVHQRQPVRLQALLERALRLLKDGPELDGIRVVRDFAPADPPIDGDARQLEQVFLNLIHNALHAMEGGGTLTLSSRVAESEAIVSVQDSGVGIPASVVENIFQPFFTTKHRGSGLGLSIVKKIVEAHGGNVRVESEPGKGTTVTVGLPRVEIT